MISAFQRTAFQDNAFQIDASAGSGTILMPGKAGGAAFSRKRWKAFLAEIQLEFEAEAASLQVAEQQDEPIDYAARADRVAAIHQRALALEQNLAAQSLTSASGNVARFAARVAKVEAAYQAAQALQIAIEEDEDDIMLLAIAA